MGCGGSKTRDTDSDNDYEGNEEQQGLVSKECKEQEEPVAMAAEASGDDKQPNGAIQLEGSLPEQPPVADASDVKVDLKDEKETKTEKGE